MLLVATSSVEEEDFDTADRWHGESLEWFDDPTPPLSEKPNDRQLCKGVLDAVLPTIGEGE